MPDTGVSIDAIQIHPCPAGLDVGELREEVAVERTNSRSACLPRGALHERGALAKVPELTKKARGASFSLGGESNGDGGRCRLSRHLVLGAVSATVLLLLGAGLGLAVSAATNAGAVVQDCRVNTDGLLVDARGAVVQAASAETVVGADGTLRRRPPHGSNLSRPVASARLESWSTLADLPMQPLVFLEHLQRISVHVNGRAEMYTISGFKWWNTSYMELETTRERDLVIGGGKAFLREASSGKILHATAPASEPSCGRRLAQGASQAPRAYSWAGIVDRYRQEAAPLSRRLSPEDESMAGMLRWFGALVSSEVAAEQAQSQASAALNSSYCDFSTRGLECDAYETSLSPQPPHLSFSGFMRFIVREDSDARDARDESFGDLLLFYIDFSDWALGKTSPQVRQKVAARVTLPTRDLDEGGFPSWIDITEFIGSNAYRYEMPHPAAFPEAYEWNSTIAAKDRGLALSAAVLESRQYDVQKRGCKHETFHPDYHGRKGLSGQADKVQFNCDTGTFTWDVGGWRVETTANGTILAFTAFDGGDENKHIRFVVEAAASGDDDESHPDLVRSFEEGSIFSGCGRNTPGLDGARQLRAADTMGRRLGLWTDVQAWLSGTNWCGAGTDLANTECPQTDSSHDYAADRACRRHDHCSRSDGIIGGFAARLACSCDKDLADAGGHNWAVNAVFGSRGLGRLWGCYDHGRHRRWGNRRRWRYHRETIHGEYTRYGARRYSGNLHDYGYLNKIRSCLGDLF